MQITSPHIQSGSAAFYKSSTAWYRYSFVSKATTTILWQLSAFKEWLHSICIVEVPTHCFVYSDFASALACCFANRFESASVFLVWPVIFGAFGFAAGYGLCRTSLFVCTTSFTILPRSFFDFQTSCFSSSAFKSLSEAMMGCRMLAVARY